MKLQHALRNIAFIAAAAAAHVNAAPLNSCAAADGANGCFTTIQAAIDVARSGAVIDVYPGTYHEVATDRAVAGLPGATHQFGLFIGKDNITIRGVDDTGAPITASSGVRALIKTHATNTFGPSGIFVQGDGVTLSGLGIGTNDNNGNTTPNKTIEVIGDGFALEYSDLSDLQGSVYINDFRYDATNGVSHVRAYRIEGNNFQDGVSIDLASGAGVSGPVHGRLIRDNSFVNSNYWPAISFNGADTGVKWYTHPVGGAVIENNSFSNTFRTDDPEDLLREGHIRARGSYDASQFDWSSYFSDNRYDKAYVTGLTMSNTVREFVYGVADADHCNSGACVFANRRIGALLEGEQAIARAGDQTKQSAQ